MESGSDLSSQAVASQVLSTRGSLTSVFRMGTGVASQPLPPEKWNHMIKYIIQKIEAKCKQKITKG